MRYDHSNYSISQLMTFNFERGGGLIAKEISGRIGEDAAFDKKVTQVSPKRFEEIMSAYKKSAINEARTRKTMLLPKGDKAFKDINDHFLANIYAIKLLTEALRQGFRIPGEKSSREKAEQAKIDLMLYLIEVGSPDAHKLSDIIVEEPEALTLDKFIDGKRNEVREAFSSYRQEKYSDDRFNRIFTQIKNEIKKGYENFIKQNKRRARKKELLLSTEQIIDMLAKQRDKIEVSHKQAAETIKSIDADLKEKALYVQTLQQKHDYFHQKDNPNS